MLNLSGTDALRRNLEALAARLVAGAVTVGVHSDAGAENVKKAAANEYGTTKIPARPFMRFTFEKNKSVYERLLTNIVNDIVYDRVDLDYAYNALGERVSRDIKREIKEWKDPPNAASTIAKKGRDDPLVDTGDMMRSVSYKLTT